MEQPTRWVLEQDGYGRSPAVCVDRRGRAWAAWIFWGSDGERVRLRYRVDPGDWSEPIDCPSSGFVSRLAIAPYGDAVAVAWIGGPSLESDGLKLCAVDSDGPGEPRLVVAGRRRPAYPAMDGDGERLALTWTAREPAGRRVEGWIGESLEAPFEAVVVSPRGGFHLRPDVALCGGRALFAWQEMSKRGSRILARATGGAPGVSDLAVVRSDSEAISAMPCLCRDAAGSGAFIAWQSDADEDDEPGLVRGIEVGHFDGELRFRVPRAEMRGVDREARGEDQGFEAPSLACPADGRLVVIGRGSQSIRRQDLGAAGWTELARVDEEGWHCRGGRFDCAAVADGILIVGREKDGVAARLLPLRKDAGSGQPELVLRGQKTSPVSLATPPTPLSRHVVAGKRVLFGDLHQHTSQSDGTGTIEEALHRARYRYNDEMAAVADHESFLGKRTPPGEWQEVIRVADEAYEPGAFVAIAAYEWTGKMHPGPGHKVVYLPPDGGPVWSREDAATSTSQGLLAAVRRAGALAFPHHVGWTGADMEHHDPKVQSCWEIVSCHGAYERPGVGPIGTRGDDKPGQFVGDALDSGLRFGLVGGSDGHGLNWHHGVCRIKDSHRTGLTALFAEEVSREGVFEALRRRRCYATSGAKICLWFEVDGRPMGEELVSGGPVPFRVVVASTAPIEAIAIVTNGGAEIPLSASGIHVDVRGTLPPPATDLGWCYYYVRVLQKDGEVAWSSPVWLDAPESA